MGEHPFALVHGVLDIEQRLIIVVCEVQNALFGIQELAHVTRKVHRRIVLDARRCHLTDTLNRKIHIEPVLSVIDVAVIVDLIDLAVLTGRVIHKHHIIAVQVLIHIFLIERQRRIFLSRNEFVRRIVH